MCSANKMQSNYVWIITLLANLLIATSSNVERPKRDLVFLKTIIANIFGYNTNNAFMTNENNIKILYPVPNYQVLMNMMPDPYLKQSIYKETLPKILMPRNMVMQPVINFGRPYVPFIKAFNERNYKSAYENLHFLPVNGNMQRVIPVPNYNSVRVPLDRCNDKILVSCKKSEIKDKNGDVSSDFGKHGSHKLPQFHNFRDTDEISKEVDVQKVSQLPQSKNILKTSTSTPRLPVKNIQHIKTSTTSPISTVNIVQTKLSPFYAETTSRRTKRMQISTSRPPYSTNTQELITSHAVTIVPTLTTARPLPPLPVKNIQTVETLQPILPFEKKDEAIKTTSPARISTIPADYMQPNNKDEMNNHFNSYNLSSNIDTVNKPNKETVFEIENIKYPKDAETTGDLMAQPSIFSNVKNDINSIAPIRGKVVNKPHTYIPQESDDMEVNKESTDVYPNDSKNIDYVNRSPVILDEPSYGSVKEENSQNKSNDSGQGLRWVMSSDSEREISRGDVPDV